MSTDAKRPGEQAAETGVTTWHTPVELRGCLKIVAECLHLPMGERGSSISCACWRQLNYNVRRFVDPDALARVAKATESLLCRGLGAHRPRL
jgi:hypothetical protein